MREILFKAKRSDNNEWVEGLYYFNACESTCQIVDFIQVPPSYQEPGGDQYNKFYNIDPDTLCQYTGKTTIKGNKLFENDIVFDEISEDEGDIRYYYVCKWIEEFGGFALLSYGELIEYEDRGVDAFDRAWPYNLEDVDRYHYAGSYIDNPELLEINL